RACIAQSTCPGEDCVHSGWISSPGRSVVCLPNRVEIRITGSSEVDFVVG
ncbi:MAG: NusG domain II-containing protein, partial [Oscillospiraceae bacterium]|nr:NusG domain II-containing protein [Oscillospiraceae bacterium]